jgi:hypothetical protein
VLKFEQKDGTSLHTPCCKDASRGKRLSVSLYRGLEVRIISGNPLVGLSKVVVESVFVPCEGGIEVPSSESELVSRSFSVFFVLGGVLFRGKVDETGEVVVDAVSDDLVAPSVKKSSS